MDNNAAEHSIRGFCIGKHNWHLIDSIDGAKASAVIYSLAETAKANNLKPYNYFEYLLTQIPKNYGELIWTGCFRGRRNCRQSTGSQKPKGRSDAVFSDGRYSWFTVYATSRLAQNHPNLFRL